MESSPAKFASGGPDQWGSPSKTERFVIVRSIVACADEWSGNEATEQLAFTQALKLLPDVPAIRYFAFPWSRLIALRPSGQPGSDRLRERLTEAKRFFKNDRRIATVCQHRDLLKHQDLFAETGITDIFWPHVQSGQICLPNFSHIRLWPFPAAPLPVPHSLTHGNKRSRLLSLAKNGTSNLEHDLILKQLLVDPRTAMVPERVSISADERPGQDNATGTNGSWQILHDSQFILCLDPGSPLLWTALASETIPVFLDKAPPLPGNRDLWEQATVCYPARRGALAGLPAHLEQLAENEALLEHKRCALRQLRFLYGAEYYIYDILKLFISSTEAASTPITAPPNFTYDRLHHLAIQLLYNDQPQLEALANVFTLGCCSRILTDPLTFSRYYQEDNRFHLACLNAFTSCKETYRELLRQALALKGLALQDCGAVISDEGPPGC